MKRIPLTKGQFALVDDDDFDKLSQHKWRAQWNPDIHSYYAVRSIRLPNGKQTAELMHRRILGLERGDRRQGDHINHATLDNRRSNIRSVTQSENQHNRRAKGYCWHKAKQKYQAKLMIHGVNKFVGLFDTPQEARTAYLAAKAVLHPTSPTLV